MIIRRKSTAGSDAVMRQKPELAKLAPPVQTDLAARSLRKRFPIYSQLLKLYPMSYRQKYSQQTLQTLADMLDDSENSKTVVWLTTVLDLPLSLTKQNLIYAGAIMKTETPYYVKRNAVLSATLLLPFFVIVASRTLQHNHLYSSFAWQSSLWITLLVMPIMAFLLSVYTFLKWSHGRKMPLWKSLQDIRRSWMMVGVGLLALAIAIFVPFHDVAHCVKYIKIGQDHFAQQTWHCIQNS